MLTKVTKKTVYWPAPWPATLEKAVEAMSEVIGAARQGREEQARDRERLERIKVLVKAGGSNA